MSTFYMTYARSRPNTIVPMIEYHDIPVLTNAMHRWSDSTERFLPMWEYDTQHVIDAGGYNVQSSFVTQSGKFRKGVDQSQIDDELQSDVPFYPWDVDSYHDWLCEHDGEFEWATAMDYACEERFDGLWSKEARMDATIDNTIAHYDLDPDYKVLPVLQGKSVDDYVESWQRLKDHGIPTDHVGVGTICRISSQKDIVRVENEIRERTDVEKVHGFGVKVSAYSLGAGFDTADSQAWAYAPSNGQVKNIEYNDSGLRMYAEDMVDDDRVSDMSRRRTIHSFQAYYAYVTWLMEGESALDVDVLMKRQRMDMGDYIDHLDSHFVEEGVIDSGECVPALS